MHLFDDAFFQPEGMIEHEQDIGDSGEFVEDDGERAFTRTGGVFLHGIHPCVGRIAGYIVYSDMEDGALVRHGPFHRYGGLAGIHSDSQGQTGFDIVVIRE